MSYSNAVQQFFTSHPDIPVPEYSNWAHLRIGVDQPPAGVAYPFIHGSVDITSRILDIDLLSLRDSSPVFIRIDWFVSSTGMGYVPRTSNNYIDWPNLTLEEWAELDPSSVSGYAQSVEGNPVTAVHAADVHITDSEGNTVIDTRDMNYISLDTTAWYTIHQWSNDNYRLQIIERIKSNDTAPAGLWPQYVAPASSYIAGESIRFKLKDIRTSQPVIVFEPGYNTVITPSVDESSSNLVFDFIAGSGKGLAPDDPLAVNYLLSVKGIKPDSRGNLQLQAKDCYSVVPYMQTGDSGVQLIPNTLNLTSSCIPCCTCQDYVNVYEAQRSIVEDINLAIGRYRLLADNYNTILDRFKNAKDISPVKAQVISRTANTIQFMIGYCNTSEHCVRDVYLFAEFDYYIPAEGTIPARSYATDAGDGYIASEDTYKLNDMPLVDLLDVEKWQTKPDKTGYIMGGEYPYYWGYFNGINPGTMGAIFFTVQWDEATSDSTVIMATTGFSAPYSIPATLEVSPVPDKKYGEHPRRDTYAYKALLPNLKIVPASFSLDIVDEEGDDDDEVVDP